MPKTVKKTKPNDDEKSKKKELKRLDKERREQQKIDKHLRTYVTDVVVPRAYHAVAVVQIARLPNGWDKQLRAIIGKTGTQIQMRVQLLKKSEDVKSQLFEPITELDEIADAIRKIESGYMAVTSWCGNDESLDARLRKVGGEFPGMDRMPVLQIVQQNYANHVVGLGYEFHLVPDDAGLVEARVAPPKHTSLRQRISMRTRVSRGEDVSRGNRERRTLHVNTHGMFRAHMADHNTLAAMVVADEEVDYTVLIANAVPGDKTRLTITSPDGHDLHTIQTPKGHLQRHRSVNVLGAVSSGSLDTSQAWLGMQPRLSCTDLVGRLSARLAESSRKHLVVQTSRLEMQQHELMELTMKVQRLRTQVDVMEQGGDEVFRRQLAGLTDLPGVVSTSFDTTGFFVTTETFDHVSELHGNRHLGAYELYVNVESGGAWLRNLSMAKATQPACTTRTERGVCLGSYSSIFSSAVASNDFAALVSAMVEFVRDPHLDDSSARDKYVKAFPAEAPSKPIASARVTLFDAKKPRSMMDDDDDDDDEMEG